MLATFDFKCPVGHVFEETVETREGEVAEIVLCPSCSKPAEKTFTPTTNLWVPECHRAPGSVGSTSEFIDRDREFKRSPRDRKMQEQNERITRRAEAVQNSYDRHVQDAVNSPKLQQAYYDMEHEKATKKPEKKKK